MLLLREIENRSAGTNSPGRLSEYKPVRKHINHLSTRFDEATHKRERNITWIGAVTSLSL